MAKEAKKDPFKPLKNAKDPVQALINEVMKLEQKYIDYDRPPLHEDLLKAIKEVIK